MNCPARTPIVTYTAKQPVTRRPLRAAIVVFSLSIAVLAISILLTIYAGIPGRQPTDEELIATFLAHESDFEALAAMLDSDRERLPPGAESFGLRDLMAAGADTARLDSYGALLARIHVKNFRFWPRSGNVVLVANDSVENHVEPTRSYVYLAHDESRHLLFQPNYSWRGPGMYLVNEDRRIKGHWFIHHGGTVSVAFAPY